MILETTLMFVVNETEYDLNDSEFASTNGKRFLEKWNPDDRNFYLRLVPFTTTLLADWSMVFRLLLFVELQCVHDSLSNPPRNTIFVREWFFLTLKRFYIVFLNIVIDVARDSKLALSFR